MKTLVCCFFLFLGFLGPQDDLNRVRALMTEGKVAEAKTLCEQVLQQDPRTPGGKALLDEINLWINTLKAGTSKAVYDYLSLSEEHFFQKEAMAMLPDLLEKEASEVAKKEKEKKEKKIKLAFGPTVAAGYGYRKHDNSYRKYGERSLLFSGGAALRIGDHTQWVNCVPSAQLLVSRYKYEIGTSDYPYHNRYIGILGADVNFNVLRRDNFAALVGIGAFYGLPLTQGYKAFVGLASRHFEWKAGLILYQNGDYYNDGSFTPHIGTGFSYFF